MSSQKAADDRNSSTNKSEVDLDQAISSAPLANLKSRKFRKDGFRVSLSTRAVEIAWKIERIKVSDYVFPDETLPWVHGRAAIAAQAKLLNRRQIPGTGSLLAPYETNFFR